MKRLGLLLVSIVFTGIALAATPPSASDRDFYAKAAEGGMAEVEAGKLAQTKGASKGVRDFGAMMVKDHTQANEKLKAIATQKGVMLPKELNAKHQKMKRDLEAAQGAQFDALYIKGQIEDHEETQALLQKEIDSGQDAQAKAWAKEVLPTVKAHLKKVQQMSEGKSGDAADDRHSTKH